MLASSYVLCSSKECVWKYNRDIIYYTAREKDLTRER